MKYVFDTLDAGRSWHPPGREPTGAAFLPMVEAEETYRDLSAKGQARHHGWFYRALVAGWQEAGLQPGVCIGYSGVAIFDPATKETELLIVPGKDPSVVAGRTVHRLRSGL